MALCVALFVSQNLDGRTTRAIDFNTDKKKAKDPLKL